jgi:hypothetical protein
MKIHKDFIHILYNNIHEVLGIDHLDEEKKELALEILARRLENSIETHLTTIVPEPHRSRLTELISDEAISHEIRFAHIHNHIPNFLEIVEKEVRDLKNELLKNPTFNQQ